MFLTAVRGVGAASAACDALRALEAIRPLLGAKRPLAGMWVIEAKVDFPADCPACQLVFQYNSWGNLRAPWHILERSTS